MACKNLKENMIFLVLRFNTEIPAETKLHFFKKIFFKNIYCIIKMTSATGYSAKADS